MKKVNRKRRIFFPNIYYRAKCSTPSREEMGASTSTPIPVMVKTTTIQT